MYLSRLLSRLLFRDGNKSPDDRHGASEHSHPNDRDGGWDAHEVLWEVKRGEQETERARLHSRLDSDRSARGFLVLERSHDPVAREATNQVEQKGGDLKRHAGAQDARRAVGDSSTDENDGGRDADDRREGFNTAAKLRDVLVQGQAGDDRNEHDLNGGDGHADGVDIHHRAERELADERRHEDAANRRGRGHEHGKRDVTLGDVRAKVARLSTVDGADEDETGEKRSAETQRVANDKGEQRHEDVARHEAETDNPRLGEHALEIVNRERDAHGEHQQGQARRVRVGRHKRKRVRLDDAHDGGENGPDREQVGKNLGKLLKGFHVDDGTARRARDDATTSLGRGCLKNSPEPSRSDLSHRLIRPARARRGDDGRSSHRFRRQRRGLESRR